MEGGGNPTLSERLKDLGESSALHGIPKVVASKQIAVKVLWGMLLCGAIVMFCLQFRLLVEEYRSYPVKTSMSLKFDALPFPAVTICNMNPIRLSALRNEGADVAELKKLLFSNSETTAGATRDPNGVSIEDRDEDDHRSRGSNDYERDSHEERSDRDHEYSDEDDHRSRGSNDHERDSYEDRSDRDHEYSDEDHDHERDSYEDRSDRDHEYSYEDDHRSRASNDHERDSDESRSDSRQEFSDEQDLTFNNNLFSATGGDNYDLQKTTFYSQLKDMPSEARERLGHQLDDFILHSQYNGSRFQPSSRFTTLLNIFYGNCFTIDDLPDAFSSGQNTGLSLAINLELSEYLDVLTPALGVIVVIHEQGSYPLPERNGFILNAGFETNVGLKRVRTNRLGGVYGSCDDSLKYTFGENNYGHSVSLCHTLCESNLVAQHCGCATLETPIDATDLRTCTAEDAKCVDHSRQLLFDALSRCDCPTKCSDDSYVTTITGRTWPFETYLRVMFLKDLCKDTTSFRKSHEGLCENYDAGEYNEKDYYTNINKNILKVNIYFEDINYEEISEEALYNTVRFLSNIGGMMGFFLGASLLTYVESLQLIMELMLHMKQRFWNAKTEPERGAPVISVNSLYPSVDKMDIPNIRAHDPLYGS